MAKSLVSCFFDSRCTTSFYLHEQLISVYAHCINNFVHHALCTDKVIGDMLTVPHFYFHVFKILFHLWQLVLVLLRNWFQFCCTIGSREAAFLW